MKSFYTLVDKNNKPVRLYLKNKLFCVEAVPIEECAYFKGINSARNTAILVNKEVEEESVRLINCEKPFKANEVVIYRKLV